MKTLDEIKEKFGNITVHNTKNIIKDKKVTLTNLNHNNKKEIHLEFFFNEKVSVNGNRRVNPCSIDIRLEETEYERGIRLSVVGNVWNSRKTDLEHCGQCQDNMKRLIDMADWKPESIALFDEICSLWEKHHLFGIYSNYDGPIPEDDMFRIWSLFNM